MWTFSVSHNRKFFRALDENVSWTQGKLTRQEERMMQRGEEQPKPENQDQETAVTTVQESELLRNYDVT